MRRSYLKRPFDLGLALAGLVVSSALWAVCSLAVYLEDGGPVFFVQERCGRGGKAFRALKFRTMRVPKDGEDRLDIDLECDPRVTKVGRLLRATALDELPELVNILKGDMSFVGPRPLPYLIEDEESLRYRTLSEVPGFELRTRVRPGLTGLAQVYAPKSADRRIKFRYDNVYVRSMNLSLDLRLILLSLWVAALGRWERRGRKV